MPRQITNSLFNSLRGRIWISTSVLAFFICTFGLISYLVVTLLVNDVFYGIFIPFLFLAFVVVVFGWWLSNEIVSPIEKVTLLSKSLERTSSTSLPKTSGSYETDQLLQSLFRNSQQVQMLVALMEKVASGNLEVSLAPLEGSDRLSSSFQKLLAKVSESISAKEDLDKLQASLDQIRRELSPIRSGNLTVRVSNEDFQVKEISSTVNYLLERLTSLIKLARKDSSEASELAKDIEKHLRELVQQDESRIEELTQASITLKQVPNLVKKISEDLGNSSQSARNSIEKVQKGNEIAAQNADSVSRLRKQMREAVKRVQSLNERTQEIGKLATTVEDLANRTNMVALNASIQATELGEKGQGFALVAEEVERLAARANTTNRQIASLNKSVSTEIRKVENALELAGGEIAGFSKYSIESGNILAELGRYVGQFLNLQKNLVSLAGEHSEESDQAFMTFMNSISDSKATVDELKHSSSELANLSVLMNNLQVASAEYRVALHSEGFSESNPRESGTEHQEHRHFLFGQDNSASETSDSEDATAQDESGDVDIDVDSLDSEPEDLGIAEYYKAGEPETTGTDDIFGLGDEFNQQERP
ncbi:MAG: methyl-accepting chemotaxis protein [Acidobacteria bacterium]|nr:MAG: methyl-accepting chemotaxis protein [Acidobacteriota bacterium]REK02425.1 MAG: methyl-accepting chemotaxis protein [Acidobacteriota bacterium]REK13774.1 MAG: methyl-accepting chemotaxis protein [Acidobacteriota bacterium]REK41768.1 MAG: methyl-accepting chemotaxis protein [Acidobacteriota bacterium]